MSKFIQGRLKRLKTALKSHREPSALLLSSAPAATRSLDTHYPYRQDSDFYYLTGSHAKDLLLLVSPFEPQPVLFAPRISAQQILWEGRPEGFEALADRLKARLVIYRDSLIDIIPALKGVKVLYHKNISGSLSWNVAQHLEKMPAYRRGSLPMVFAHADNLLIEMRLYKDESEVEAIKRAVRITAEALQKTAAVIRPSTPEIEIAATIDYWFRMNGAWPAFNTIIGSGVNGATLHYEALTAKLQEGDLLLVDCGAEHELYAADVTRVFPVNGMFDERQAALYETVLAAQNSVISRIKPGVEVKKLYELAVRKITEGLKDLGILRGKVSNLIDREAYRPYFPHSIGHPLGLDVHDVWRAGRSDGLVLQPGMVMTIEPGVYLPKRTGKFKPCGIRIEDDVLVTKRGNQVLTASIPKDIAEIESLLR